MKRIIINCDDLGLTPSVNEAVKECYKAGVIKSGTVLVNAESSNDALLYFSKLEDFSCGIHLTLTFGETSSTALKYCVDGNKFKKLSKETNELFSKEDEKDIEEEFRAQLKVFLDKSNGISPSHIDSHHHVHEHPKVHKVVKKIAKELGISIRSVKGNGYVEDEVVFHPFSVDFYNVLDIDGFVKVLENAPDGADIMSHPAKTNDTSKYSSYSDQRIKEYELIIENEKMLKEKFKFTKIGG